MTLQVTDSEFRLLRDLIEERCGIFLGDEKQYLVENRLTTLAEASQCSNFGEFYIQIRNSSASADLWEAVVDAMTTNETLWLRDQHPFTVLEEIILPQFAREIQEKKRETITIWSAACSTGQEPYSIAMTALDFYSKAGAERTCPEHVQILATDISSKALATAMEGRYDNGSIVRGLPLEKRNRYFTKQDDFWVITENVRQLVTFKKTNLQEPFFWLGRFDVIFLRNVIIYFSDSFKKDLLNRIARMLNPEGYLFLGGGETVHGYTSSFRVLEHNGGIFYQLKT